ncbi:hypothetical protein B0H21DRAFT_147328 [Amylocystis lapponica]|nr:hypothetical protein B0H21DRAFT_147328 [Amylocystis lapponica]
MNTSQSTSKTRRQLSNEGKKILHDFYALKQYPTDEERKSLHLQITALPECRWYTEKLVSNWFTSRRQRDNRHRDSENQLKVIRELCTKTPNPSVDTLCAWADDLGCDPRGVFNTVLSFRAPTASTEDPTPLPIPDFLDTFVFNHEWV